MKKNIKEQGNTPFDSLKGPAGGFARHLYRTLIETGYFPDVAESIVRNTHAAPEMLEALKEIADDLLSLTDDQVKPLGVRAALNRALRATVKATNKGA